MSMLPADTHRRLFERSDADDAARYRWLRSRMAYPILCEFRVPDDCWKPSIPDREHRWPDGLDAAVDDAIHGRFMKKIKGASA